MSLYKSQLFFLSLLNQPLGAPFPSHSAAFPCPLKALFQQKQDPYGQMLLLVIYQLQSKSNLNFNLQTSSQHQDAMEDGWKKNHLNLYTVQLISQSGNKFIPIFK